MRKFPFSAEKMGLLGIVGNPLRGTLSPRMHNAALQHLGLNALYLPFEIPPGSLGDVIRAMPALRFWGMNVTIPYKEQVMKYLDEVNEEAEFLGAVNTVAVEKGRLVGYNTDGRGFIMALNAEGGINLKGESVFVFGAGGAARSIAFQMARQGCCRICLANRTRSRAESLRRHLRKIFPEVEIIVIGLEGRVFREMVTQSQVLINTTSVGTERGAPSLIPRQLISSSQLVVDIVYKPLRTPLIRAAESAGARFLNGLGMLLYQGALAFRIWTHKTAPVEVMKRALLSAPHARG